MLSDTHLKHTYSTSITFSLAPAQDTIHLAFVTDGPSRIVQENKGRYRVRYSYHRPKVP